MIINNLEFAKHHQFIKDKLEISNLSRASDMLNSMHGDIHFELTGDYINDKPALKVLIYGRIVTLCQNCLEQMQFDLKHENIVFIFKNEKELDDALFKSKDQISDGIVFDTEFNVLEFIEDEIIMSLPIAPKHEQCEGISYTEKEYSPFNVLKKLIN